LLCREEAADLAELLPQLGEMNVPLVAILHEQKGAEEFQPYIKGQPLYYDPKRSFFKAIGDRWLGISGFVRPSVWSNVNRAKGKGIEGNMQGEGRLLGGTLVVAPHDQGIVFEHREGVWGDHAEPADALAAVQQMHANKQQQ